MTIVGKSISQIGAAAALFGALLCSPSSAATILTDVSSPGDANYNNFNSDNTSFLSIFNADHTINYVPSFANAADFVGVDAIWANAQINSAYGGGGAFSATEVSNILSFISSGHKGVIITDNDYWGEYNGTIEQIIGATITNVCDTNTGVASATNPLGAGVGTVDHQCGSILDPAPNAEVIVSAGISSLYSVGLGEVLVITSVDLFRGASPHEPEFIQNISTYLSSPLPTVTPLPAALPSFATALGGFGVFSWRRKQRATKDDRPAPTI